MARVPRLVDDFTQPGTRVRLVLDTRNAIVHVGHDPRTELEAVLGEVASFMSPVLSTLGLTDAIYWGDSWAMVSAHVERRLSDIEAAYERKVQAAKALYKQIVDTMDEPARLAYLTAAETTTVSDEYDVVPVDCPACGNRGALTGQPDPQWEADWSDVDEEAIRLTPTWKTYTLVGASFQCGACRLSLSGDLLSPADLRYVTVDPKLYDSTEAEFYFARIGTIGTARARARAGCERTPKRPIREPRRVELDADCARPIRLRRSVRCAGPTPMSTPT